jgi:hypothetical protein
VCGDVRVGSQGRGAPASTTRRAMCRLHMTVPSGHALCRLPRAVWIAARATVAARLAYGRWPVLAGVVSFGPGCAQTQWRATRGVPWRLDWESCRKRRILIGCNKPKTRSMSKGPSTLDLPRCRRTRLAATVASVSFARHRPFKRVDIDPFSPVRPAKAPWVSATCRG